MKSLPSKVIAPHKKDCFMNRSKVPWSGIIKETYWGNFAANRNATRGRNYMWHVLTCNDPSCTALKAVHSNVLSEAK